VTASVALVREGGDERRVARIHDPAAEERLDRGRRQPVEEERHLVVDLPPLGIPHDHRAEESPVDVGDEIHAVVVERPRADRVLGRVEDVAPLLARTDLIAPPAVVAHHSERPRAVGVDAVLEAVHVQAVRTVVAVQDVDEEALAGLGIDDRARHPPLGPRLVRVRGDQRRRVQRRVGVIEVLAVHERVEPSALDLGVGDRGVFMAMVAHAVEAVAMMLGVVRRDRAVRGQLLDLQVDVAAAMLGPALFLGRFGARASHDYAL
jgi:hypothetical protein